MSAAESLDLPPMTFADYVEFERTSDVKHEIWDGTLIAMAGATKRHNLVSKNVLFELETVARGGSTCDVFGSDQMVYTPFEDRGAYPDVSAVCGDQEFEKDGSGEDRILLNPGLVVEVLSRSTAWRDIGPKFEWYQSIPSLVEYVLIDPTKLWVRLYRRNETGWLMRTATSLSETVELHSVDASLRLEDIYRGVDVDQKSSIIRLDKLEDLRSGDPDESTTR